MDVNRMADNLYKAIVIGEKIDSTGAAGVYGLSGGETTSEECLHMELCMFVLDIFGDNTVFTPAKLRLLDLASGEKHNELFYRLLKGRTSSLSPEVCFTLQGYAEADKILTGGNGYRTTTCTDMLISVFEDFGALALSIENNASSQEKYRRYISGLKEYVRKNI